MRPLLVTICCLSALTAACDGDRGVRITSTTSERSGKGVLKVVDALQCPETMGSLTRKGSAQADGKVCVYTGPRGAEVSLHLVTLDDQTADQALKVFETQLLSVMPHTAAQMQQGEARAEADAARAEAAAGRAAADGAQASADGAQAAADSAQAAADGVRAGAAAASADETVDVTAPGVRVEARNDRARVRLPGIRIDTDGDKASVNIGGLHINTDDSDASVNLSSSEETVSIQAHEDAAQIRTRAPGDATRQTFLLTDNRPSEAGWRLVGYEARGPRGGPIVVATVRAKDRNSDGVFDDAKDLVTLNVGE